MMLNKLRILGADERATDLRDTNGDVPATIPDLLDAARETWGDKIAFQQKVRRDWTRISHSELYERSYDIAAGLRALGLRKRDRAAIICENSIDWVCAYYGIVLNGAVAVPMYYDLKPSELEEMVRHAEPRILITSPKMLPKVEGMLGRFETVVVAGGETPIQTGAPSGLLRRHKPDVLSLDDVARRSTPAARNEVDATAVEPDDVASIVFTSGTTGGLKGVMLTHGNFMANLQSVRRSIPFNSRDRLVMVLPMHHAFPFLVSVVVAPAVGGELTFENDLRRIRDRMVEIKPTLMIAVPQLLEVMYRNIVQRAETEGRLETLQRALRIVETTKQRTGGNIGRIVFRELHKRMGGSLRFIVSGGAALNPQIGRNFAALGIPVLQGWGLTEAAPVLAVQRWNPRKFYMSNYYEEHFGTVGPALDGIEIGLIDVPEKELYVHLHGEGELVARGGNITPGYWRSEEATKAIRVGEWLRTGDVGYIDDEGNVWITGRSKFVIVLDSGEKVHPDEVEEKLERSEVIQDVAVIPRKARGKTQTWAVVYPNHDVVLESLGGAVATEEAVRKIVATEISANEADIAPYKRVADFMLSDTPLPRTLPLRKIARGQIGDNYTFEARRWEQTWREYLAATATPGASAADGDSESEEAAVVR